MPEIPALGSLRPATNQRLSACWLWGVSLSQKPNQTNRSDQKKTGRRRCKHRASDQDPSDGIPPVTPAPGHPEPPSDLSGHPHTCGTYHTCPHDPVTRASFMAVKSTTGQSQGQALCSWTTAAVATSVWRAEPERILPWQPCSSSLPLRQPSKIKIFQAHMQFTWRSANF